MGELLQWTSHIIGILHSEVFTSLIFNFLLSYNIVTSTDALNVRAKLYVIELIYASPSFVGR